MAAKYFQKFMLISYTCNTIIQNAFIQNTLEILGLKLVSFAFALLFTEISVVRLTTEISVKSSAKADETSLWFKKNGQHTKLVYHFSLC